MRKNDAVLAAVAAILLIGTSVTGGALPALFICVVGAAAIGLVTYWARPQKAVEVTVDVTPDPDQKALTARKALQKGEK